MLDKLIARQQALRLSDAKFAMRLGLGSREAWSSYKTGRVKPPLLELAQLAMRAFPDMTADAVIFFLSEGRLPPAPGDRLPEGTASESREESA